NPGWAAAAVLLVVVAAGSLAYAVALSSALGRARDAEGSLTVKVSELQQTERQTQENLYDSLVAQPEANRLSQKNGRRCGSLELLDRAGELARRLELPDSRRARERDATVGALMTPDLMLGPEILPPELSEKIGPVRAACFDQDRKLLATD